MQSRKSRLIEAAYEILSVHHPMTVRQVYYRLVARQTIENSRGRYQSVSIGLRDARKDGTIPWEWIEDRIRSEVEARFDVTALAAVTQIEDKERERLMSALANL